MRYRLSQEAALDLEQIVAYGATQYGEKSAISYVYELTKVFALIAENQQMARPRDDVLDGIRVHMHKAHMIAYRARNMADIVIVRVLYRSLDWQNILS